MQPVMPRIQQMSSMICPTRALLGMQEPAWGLLGILPGASTALPRKASLITTEKAPIFHSLNLQLHPKAVASAFMNPNVSSELLQRIPSLVEMSKGGRTKLHGNAPERPAAWHDFRQFRVSSIRKVADSYSEFTFTPTDGNNSSIDFAPGQHLKVKTSQENATLRHCFVTSAPGRNYLQCCMKSCGRDSSGLKLNAVVGLTAPTGISFLAGIPKVLISAGIGAAPMKSFLEGNRGDVQFAMHVDENEASHPFRSEFRRSCVDAIFHYTSKAGPASSEALVKVLQPHLACDFILCGPGDFVKSMEHALTAMGAKGVHSLALDARLAPKGQLEPEPGLRVL
jgi:ferredoxin-NADP reductase